HAPTRCSSASHVADCASYAYSSHCHCRAPGMDQLPEVRLAVADRVPPMDVQRSSSNWESAPWPLGISVRLALQHVPVFSLVVCGAGGVEGVLARASSRRPSRGSE